VIPLIVIDNFSSGEAGPVADSFWAGLGVGITVATLVVAYGLYRRRPWIVGVGYVVCAGIGAQLLLPIMPVAIAAGWALSRRRENAFY
jgi:hypothetical protein